MLEAFAITALGVLAAQAAPGPNLMAVAGTGLSQGRRHALFVVAGVVSGIFVWASAVALGLGAFLEAYPVSLTILRFAGGAYLLFLAFNALRAAVSGKAVSIRADAAGKGLVQAWRRGLFVVLTNPKAALMWAAVASFLFGQGLSPVEVLAFGPVGAATAALIYGTYAMLFSSRVAVRGYSRISGTIEALFGALFGAFGAKLVFDGIRDLRS